MDIGFERELMWSRSLQSPNFEESDLLRESAWVILCSGFRESVVRRHFDFISLCFGDWASAQFIVDRAALCRRSAFTVFRNTRKIDAIVGIANDVSKRGFDAVQKGIAADPLNALAEWPYIGKITAQHLAKNLGFNFAKSDRHVMRIADHFGFRDAQSMCEFLAAKTGDSVPTVDTVLWRYAASVLPKLGSRVRPGGVLRELRARA